MKATGTNSVKCVNSKFTRKSWIEDSNSKRITPKFMVFNKKRVDKFVILSTDYGVIIYHKELNYLLYFNNRIKEDVYFTKIDDNIYNMEIYEKENKWFSRLYNDEGLLLTDEFEKLRMLKNGLIAAKKNGLWGFVDDNLNEVIPCIYKYVEDFTKFGFAIVILQDDKRAVIDIEGNYILKPTNYSCIKALSYSFLQVQEGNRCGIINLAGNVIVPLVYNDVWLENNYFMVRLGKKYGLIGLDGTIIFECIYSEIIETPDKFVVQDFAKLEIQKN